jgi:hypothetical protein
MSDDIETIECCPACETHRYRRRKTKSPTYRCSVCKHEFDEPATRRARYHDQVEPEATWPNDSYEELRNALRRTVAAGSQYARSSLIADYTDELSASEVGTLLAEWGVDDGLVSKRHQNTSGTLWHIEIGDTQASGRAVVADD